MAVPQHDVAVVGASVAGSAAAIFLARAGLRVALIERNPDPAAYKRVCTHFIQSSATPTMQRLGLVEPIERAGGVRNSAHIWTPWGWIRPPDEPRPRGYNIRRQTLDPMLRRMAMDTPGVDYIAGETARELLREHGRVTGVRLESVEGRTRTVPARLVVGADGRNSRIAEQSGLPADVRHNHRFAYFAYFRNLSPPAGNASLMWMRNPDVAYVFPNEDGITILACMPTRERLPAFKADLDRAFREYLLGFPDMPDFTGAERISGMLGMLDMPNISRPASMPGLALVGDAALASDPLWGVGCGWALQSAEWLAESTVEALRRGGPVELDRGLVRYRKRHARTLNGHHRIIVDYASGRPFNLVERLFFPASVRDPATARHFEAFGSRRISPGEFLRPTAVLRAAWVNLMHR